MNSTKERLYHDPGSSMGPSQVKSREILIPNVLPRLPRRNPDFSGKGSNIPSTYGKRIRMNGYSITYLFNFSHDEKLHSSGVH
jgi:hypothetical protein